MHTPIPFPIPPQVPEPPGTARPARRNDVLWNRPVFKAPPLRIKPEFFEAAWFEREFRRVETSDR